MITKKVMIQKILFEPLEPGEKLTDSIRRRGIAIPVRVNVEEDHYVCLDGRKRLTASLRLIEEEEKFAVIPVMILNDFSKAGSAYWGNTRNHH